MRRWAYESWISSLDNVIIQSKLWRLIALILIVLVIIWLVDIERTWVLLKGADLYWLAIAFFVVQLQVILSAVRWQITAKRLGQTLSLQRAVSEYYLATLANLSLPGGISGDAARIYRSRQDKGWQLAIMSVTIERFSGQFVLFFVTLAGWLMWPLLYQQSAPAKLHHLLLSFGLLLLAFVIAATLFGRLSTRIRRFVSNIGPAIRRVWIDDNQWAVQLFLSLMIISTYVGVFAISAKSIAEPIPLIALVTLVPVVLLSMVVPLSIGGWGIRELAAASLWPFVSLSPEAGIASSVIYGLVSVLAVLPGACLCLLLQRRAQSVVDESPEDRL